MIHPNLEQAAEDYIRDLFARYPSAHLPYHSLDHTMRVVAHSQDLAFHYRLSPEDTQVLVVAAWFHDVGHLNGAPEGHEERSLECLSDFLQGQGIDDPTFAQAVCASIMATHFPHGQPQGLLQEIICDADTWHFGTEEFRESNKLVKQELALRGLENATKKWKEKSLTLLKAHRFFTSYARETLEAGKQSNMDLLRAKIRADKEEKAAEKDAKASEKPADKAKSREKGKSGKRDSKPEKKQQEKAELVPVDAPELVLEQEKKEAKKEASLVTRGIQTMLRLASENHMKLSDMADGKSNILISVNAIIISVIVGVMVRKLETEPYLMIPTLIFLTSSVTTIVLAILATRPKVTEGNFTREQVQQKKTNLLFFGNFYRATKDEYRWAMDRLMGDKDYLYSSLITDIYFLGVVLGRKYRLLRLAYNIFMVGIVVSVVSFTLAVILSSPEQRVQVTNGVGSPL